MKEETIKILKKFEQEHILEYVPILNEKEKNKLEEQILKIDFKQLKEIYEKSKEKTTIENKKIENIPYIDKEKLSEIEIKELKQLGEKVIKEGKYALVTMAGGQGTRLGHAGPKGTYSISTINGKKFLFEIIIDKLKKATIEYNITIPWYIMTSRENNDETIDFLEEHNYFGYDKTKVKFFKQGELPLVDTKGKVILDKDKKIKQAANGNGGIYEAMEKNKILEDMKIKKIEWIFINGIDNILSNFLDPILLGLTIKQKNLIASKSVVKSYPKEKAGVFCKMNGRPKVIEYIDLPDEMAEQTDSDGELLYGEIHILSNLFNIKVLEDLVNTKLPYHAAFKKSGYLKSDGNFIEGQEPNVYKFEAFIFDAFTRCDNITILRTKREEEFAPIKNKDGNDSPKTAIKLYNDFYSK